MHESMKLLIVDDDRDSGDSLAELLGILEHECVVVRDGEQALEIASTRTFDAILMDLKMPGLSGLEVSRELLRRDPTTKIIVMTGNCVEQELQEVRRLPIVELLRKPFRSSELKLALVSCIER